MYKELVREQKLRPYGGVDGEKISDPRNYMFVDYKVRNRNGGMGVLLRRRGEKQWQASFLGRADYTVMRDGWVRTTVELPPGTKASDLGEIAFQCLVISKEGGSCELQEMGKIFALGA